VTVAHSISAIVPIYNERASLPGVIEQIDGFLAAHFADYEIIIVESGSTDGTAEACDELPSRLPRVRVIHEGGRNGLGNAIRTGAAVATKRWIWPLVVDMPFPLESIVTAQAHLDAYRVVISYRSDDPRTAFRRFQSLVFNTLARLLLGVRARHVNSAFKVVDRELFESLNLRSRGWLLDAELITGLERRGIKYAEIPVPLIERTTGTSSVGPMAAVNAFRDLIKLSLERWR